MTEEQVARLEQLARMKAKARKSVLGLEDEKKALEKLRREAPLMLHDPFRLRIDWFLDAKAGGGQFKTWAGQQSVLDIGRAMKRPLEAGGWNALPPDRWFTQPSDDDSLPCNFDSDVGCQASALDRALAATRLA
jgi:CRISPR-associated protein Csx14